MPELTWSGKDKVVNHHHDVPFRILEKQYHWLAGISAREPEQEETGGQGCPRSDSRFRPKEMVFYADICLLNKKQLQKYGIIFKKILRDITRF